MDTSEENIKMMGKAKEILEKWKPAIGDYYYRHATNEYEISTVVIVSTLRKNHFGTLLRLPNIWLPRQDQLQEMVNGKAYEIHLTWLGNHRMSYCKVADKLVKSFGVDVDNKPVLLMGNSMEQLWLAFVMKEKYNKTWNGGKWQS